MFESYPKPAAIKADREPIPRPGILSVFNPADGAANAQEAARLQTAVIPLASPGILSFTPQQLAEQEEERRRREQAATGGWVPPIMRPPGRPSPPPGPAIQSAPGTPGYNPAWNGLAPGMPQPAQYVGPTEPAYGYQDQMAVRNSAGV